MPSKFPETRCFLDRHAAGNHRDEWFHLPENRSPEMVDSAESVHEILAAAADPIGMGKRNILLTNQRGAFIRDCPGTKHYLCCGYKILHIGCFCTMDCSYCILQSYFHPPMLQYFINNNNLLSDIGRFIETGEAKRIGTGEFTDSLIWDQWTPLTEKLVAIFSGQSSAVLELKTKTAAVDSLKTMQNDHNRKTIMAWSLNAETVIRTEERRTAPLSARLAAAAKCESWGYPLAFHFDPLIIYDGCESDYYDVIDRLFANVSAENIVWISLGAFRFIPSLKSIIQKRFPDSRIVYGEFIPGVDGKFRYYKPLRIDLYRKIVDRIRRHAPEVVVYFCMEDEAVWHDVMGFVPEPENGLPGMLDQSAVKHCNLTP